jgi:hypothetical protein
VCAICIARAPSLNDEAIAVSPNQLLTKLDYLESWAFGARVLACRPAGSVGVDPWPLTLKS